MAVMEVRVGTADRLLAAALSAFADRGYEATSLDDIAADCDVRKQTLLYHFSSKEELLGAVITYTVGALATRVEAAIPGAVDRRRAVVDALFRIGAERPELLELIREALRLGPPASERLLTAAEPFLAQLAVGMPRDKVLGAGAMILGMATEADVLDSVGVSPTVAQLRRRRRWLLDYLSS
ncbi:MAG TPA: helix-turn-helix domain-containing protein [Acidimicrobiales bacterium]|nr:helix-turn-helix domain-containing protein [Acidimicrobiales bacterium]